MSRAFISRDPDLRRPLERLLRSRHASDPSTKIRHEFTVCGTRARIDIAVVNGLLGGYEIKSGADRLDRLPAQTRHYNRVFDRVTVVCDPKHLDLLGERVPDWYGIWIAGPEVEPGVIEVREARANPAVSSRWTARLLWRDEMLSVLERHDAAHGQGSKPKRQLVDALLELLDPRVVAAEVRLELRARLQLGSLGSA